MAVVAAASVGVHWAYDRRSAPQLGLRDTIYEHTGRQSVLISNLTATVRYLWTIDTTYLPIERRKVDVAAVSRLLRSYGEFYAVFLDRTDSEFFRSESRANERFIESLRPTLGLFGMRSSRGSGASGSGASMRFVGTSGPCDAAGIRSLHPRDVDDSSRR
jgi:hypothetical protein